jgi:two-component sensor histidine kinase
VVSLTRSTARGVFEDRSCGEGVDRRRIDVRQTKSYQSEACGVHQKDIERMKILVDEKDRLLDQKKVLAEELQHRVRNNLQLVYGMLSKQLDDTPDKAGQRGIKAISRRVSALAHVYDHLL